MRWLRSGIHLYQKTGIQKLTRKSGILKIMPWHMDTFENILPEVPSLKLELPRVVEPTLINDKHNSTIAFFTGCIQDTLFHETIP